MPCSKLHAVLVTTLLTLVLPSSSASISLSGTGLTTATLTPLVEGAGPAEDVDAMPRGALRGVVRYCARRWARGPHRYRSPAQLTASWTRQAQRLGQRPAGEAAPSQPASLRKVGFGSVQSSSSSVTKSNR